MRPVLVATYTTLAICVSGGNVRADVIASADELCDPLDNPCVISSSILVDADHPLDFGLRAVRIVRGGILHGNLDLRCGSFEVDNPVDNPFVWMVVGTESRRGFSKITARRACSENPSLPCLRDTDCSGAGACNQGDGTIRIAGEVVGLGAHLQLLAAGNIELAGNIRAVGNDDYCGGDIEAESFHGSVDSSAFIDVGGGTDGEDYSCAGRVSFAAAEDLFIRNEVHAGGDEGYISGDARDIFVQASIFARGASEPGYSDSGDIDLRASHDIRIEQMSEAVHPRLNISGSSYPGWANDGGSGELRAGNDIVIGAGVRLRSDSGRSSGSVNDFPYAGDWRLEAGRNLTVDGVISSRGRGFGGESAGIWLSAGGAISVGASGHISTRSHFGGDVSMIATQLGPVQVNGRIDLRGKQYQQGQGGWLYVEAGDLTIGGLIKNGGLLWAGDQEFRACNLRMKDGATIDVTYGRTLYPDDDDHVFEIGESMVVEPSGAILSAGPIRIRYRDIATPPLLEGNIEPTPELLVDESIANCPD